MKRTPVAFLSFLVAFTLAFSSSGAQPNGDRAKPVNKGNPAHTAKQRSDAQAPSVPGQFVIKFRGGVTEASREAAVATLGGRFFDRIPDLDVDAVEFPALAGDSTSGSAEAIINALKQNPSIEYVEPNYIYKATFTPNDPGLSQQWAWSRIQAFTAWDVTQGSSSTVISIVDTGIQRTHPDLDS